MGAVRGLALPLAAAVLAVGVASGADRAGRDDSAAAAGAPRTLLELSVPIRQFAQDGARVAWMTGRCSDYRRPLDQVALRAVSGGSRQVLAASVCGGDTEMGDTGLVLSGTRALFWWPVESGNFTYYRIATAAPGSRLRMLPGFGVAGDAYVDGAGGEGGTLIHAIAENEVTNGDCLSEPNVPCKYETLGRVVRVAAARLMPVRNAQVPAALDASGAYLAIAPAARRWSDARPIPATRLSLVPAAVNGIVDIRDSATGKVRVTFQPRGSILDLAFAADVAAVLVDKGSTLRIERYAATSGRLLGAARVPASARDLDVAGGNIVYRVGNEIRVFAGGRTEVVARTTAAPIGLSIVGRRIAWAENVDSRGRIRSVTLRR